jgi:hypothetical protein
MKEELKCNNFRNLRVFVRFVVGNVVAEREDGRDEIRPGAILLIGHLASRKSTVLAAEGKHHSDRMGPDGARG